MKRFDAERTRALAGIMFKQAAQATQEARAMREQAHESRLRLWQEKLRTYRSMGGSRDNSLELALDAALSVTAASRGNIQALTRNNGGLEVIAQRGFHAAFLNYFEYVDDRRCACGMALASRRPVTVPDVLSSPVFAHTEAAGVLLDAGVRSVASVPLVQERRVVGMLSVHYHQPNACAEAALLRLTRLADTVATLIAY